MAEKIRVIAYVTKQGRLWIFLCCALAGDGDKGYQIHKIIAPMQGRITPSRPHHNPSD